MWLLVNRGEGRLAKASSLWSLEGREQAREDSGCRRRIGALGILPFL